MGDEYKYESCHTVSLCIHDAYVYECICVCLCVHVRTCVILCVYSVCLCVSLHYVYMCIFMNVHMLACVYVY